MRWIWFLLAVPAFSQTAIRDALVTHWKVTGEFTIAVAKLMPADSYAFKPVPEELSFSQLMVQIAGANLSACGNAGGKPRPPIPPGIAAAVRDEKVDAGKDAVLHFMSDSFAFCNQVVASITSEQLNSVVGPENRKMTAFEWLWSYFTHTAHHRGQAEVYLRIQGIKPPDYVF